MTIEQVLINFANEHTKGEDSTGFVMIDNRALWVGNDVMALHSRAANVYVNINHAETDIRKKLLCFLPAGETVKVTHEVIRDVYDQVK